MANFLTFLFWHLAIFFLILEVVATVYLSRKRVKWRLSAVFGSYLLLVVLAFAFAFIGQDEFGYGLIPALQLTAPWSFVYGIGSPSILAKMALGICINLTIFFGIDKLSYPKHSNQLLS